MQDDNYRLRPGTFLSPDDRERLYSDLRDAVGHSVTDVALIVSDDAPDVVELALDDGSRIRIVSTDWIAEIRREGPT